MFRVRFWTLWIYPYTGEGVAEGISLKNKGDQEFSYLLFVTCRNVLGVSDIFDWSANGFQQKTPQKPG